MKILVIVDMQNDFVYGSLGSKEAESIVPKVINEMGKYPFEHIYATRDTHDDKTYLSTQEGSNLPIFHCIKDTFGWDIVPEILGRLKTSHIVNKNTFGSYLLPLVIYNDLVLSSQYLVRDIEEIEIVGLCTDICVISNAMILKAHFPEAKITVNASCCAGVTPKSHQTALNAMKACQINVINEE